VKRWRTHLPPRVAAGARWVAIASAIAAAAAAATTVASSSGRSVSSRSTAVAATVATLRSTSPAAAEAATTASTTTHTTDVTGSSAATATASATTTSATTATEAGALTSDRLEEGRNLLVGLLEEIQEVTNHAAVATIEEGCSNSSVSSTSSTTDPVNVVVNVGWKIVVDDVGDVRYVKSWKVLGLMY
jgi:type VI protein secretion system component VasK